MTEAEMPLFLMDRDMKDRLLNQVLDMVEVENGIILVGTSNG